MKRFPFLVCLAFLLLLVQIGITSADSPSNTTATDATTAFMTTTPATTGGTIYFETDPSDATIWLATVEIGTTPLSYYSENTGKMTVHIQKKGYEDHTDTVTVTSGKRVTFYAKLTPVPRYTGEENTPAAPVTTATTIRKSTLNIPTSWPTTTESPVDPAVVILAAIIGTGSFVIRRR
jgi:hypothetical protein